MNEMISIIMPAYGVENHLDFFKKAIKGILEQTYVNWELLIVCDGNFPNTINCVAKVVKSLKNKKIKLFRSSKQYGPGIIRNMAIPYIKGKYLTFHDTDDYSEKTRFEKLINKIDKNGVIASGVVVNNLVDNVNRYKYHDAENLLDKLVKMKKLKVPIHFSSALISTDLFKNLGGFEKYKYSSDSIFSIKLGYYRELLNIEKIPIIDEPLFTWNRHPKSITTFGENSYILKKCIKAQRKPIIKIFREQYINNEIKIGDGSKKIRQYLGIKNNLSKLEELQEINIK
jgi:glycosyltransferase involved in cell wall biosynthesis